MACQLLSCAPRWIDSSRNGDAADWGTAIAASCTMMPAYRNGLPDMESGVD